MTRFVRVTVLALFCCVFAGSTLGQEVDVPSSNVPDDSNSASGQGQSLGDLARKVRKDHTTEVQMSADDAKKLFESVDKILSFASDDTGFPKRTKVKRRLIGAEDVEKYTRQQEAKAGFAERFARSEMTMKKFGLLPRDFNLREFIVKANGKDIAAYYDDETKTISMLNWIPLDRQAPILAHELTHALQDQNYDLEKWVKPSQTVKKTPGSDDSDADVTDDSASARRAVVEGQAQVVYVDYLLAPIGRSLLNTPALIYSMEEPAVKAVADSQMLHDAPMILREAGTFPYRDGLIFEGELLAKGGKKMAFPGVFAHPPRSTHEVLQPQTYIDGEKLPSTRIPDVSDILGGNYEVFDSGGIGELDLRALLKQYGNRKEAESLAANWHGGAYVTYRKTTKSGGDGIASDKAAPEVTTADRTTDPVLPDKPRDAAADNKTAGTTTADLALLYVSRWTSEKSAERFAHIYATGLTQRYANALPQPQAACSQAPCPVSLIQVSTEEGPVIVEQWPDNTVVISESFDPSTAAKLSGAVRKASPERRAANSFDDELGSRLYEVPGFSAFQSKIGDQIRRELLERKAGQQ